MNSSIKIKESKKGISKETSKKNQFAIDQQLHIG